MLHIYTLLTNTHLFTDVPQLSKKPQGVEINRGDSKEDKKLDSSSSEVVLSRGGCVV